MCASTTTCGTCRSPFTPSSSAVECVLSCSAGHYPNSNTCSVCSSAIANCQTCSLIGGSAVCLSCFDYFYLSNSGSCSQCSSALSGCLTCSSSTTCTHCDTGHVLTSSNTCSAVSTCTVNNCDLCVTGQSTTCSVCASGYSLSGGSCTQVTCSNGRIYDTTTSSCVCP